MSDQAYASAALELRNLQLAYAAALDRRDPDALRAVFHHDATLRVFEPDATEPGVEIRGHEQLVFMIDAMRTSYAKTMHVITNCTSSIERDTATGEAYCVAHHLILDDGEPRKVAAYVRYIDEFWRAPDDAWHISKRDIHFLWTEESPVLPWETAVVRGRFG